MFADPVKILKNFGLKEDAIVADLGAGTGFYSVAVGTMVPRGKVYAVEISKDFLATIRHKAREAHLHNVEIILGDVEKRGGTKIGDSVADAVIASNILSQVRDKENFVLEIKRILKPRGRVLFIDWSSDSVFPIKIAVPKSLAEEMFVKKGFKVEKDVNAGAHHYGMILMKINE